MARVPHLNIRNFLDNLAHLTAGKEMESKGFIRDILLSRTYQQSTLPEKGFQSMQIARRLPAEFVRDNTPGGKRSTGS